MTTEYVQWNTVPQAGGSGGGDGKLDFLKLESGKTFRIRPVFYPVVFYKYFHKKDGRLRTAICGDPDTCPIKERHDDLKKPSLRFAAIVIDREDSKVKILEAPQSVFRPLGNSEEATGKNPGGGKDGSDWQVKVTGKGLSTKYDVTFIDHTPLIEAEKTDVKNALDGDKDKLKKLYKVDTPDEIEKKLFGEWKSKDSSSEDSSSGDSSSGEASSETEEENVTVNSDNSSADDFDSNWT